MKVYFIHNLISDRIYIGQTTSKFNHRRNQHISLLRNNNHFNRFLQSSWNKHGKDAFKFGVLERCKSIEELNNSEEFYITILKSMAPRGYNLETGGNNYTVSQETRLLMSLNWRSGMTDKVRKKISNTLKGNKRSPRSIAKQNLTNKAKGFPNVSSMNKATRKSIEQLDLNGNLVKVWNSMSDIHRELGISSGQICKVCSPKYKQKTAHNFKWRYSND